MSLRKDPKTLLSITLCSVVYLSITSCSASPNTGRDKSTPVKTNSEETGTSSADNTSGKVEDETGPEDGVLPKTVTPPPESKSKISLHDGRTWESTSAENDDYHRLIFKDKLYRIYDFERLARDPNHDFTVESSTDGLTFTPVAKIADPTNADDDFYYHRAFATSERMIQIIWRFHSTLHYLLHSADGKNWTLVVNPFLNTQCLGTKHGSVIGLGGAAYFSGKFWLSCLVGVDVHLVTSTDGEMWEMAKTSDDQIFTANFVDGDATLLVMNKQLFLLPSSSFSDSTVFTKDFFQTSDGRQWTKRTSSRFVNRAFLYGDKIWDLNPGTGFLTTSDGEQWSEIPLPTGFGSEANAIVPARNFVRSNSFPYSFEGRIWSAVKDLPKNGPPVGSIWVSKPGP